jgi:predicted O-methyltransferase YrrM
MTIMPAQADRLRRRAAREGFEASSEPEVGHLLAALAASKPGGLFLELGTGAGLGTASLLSGMSRDARLVTIELSGALSQAAQDEIDDPRVEWVIADGGQWLTARQPGQRRYDMVFADAWPGKFTHLDQALGLVAVGGLYVVDDLLPQPNWPASHQGRVDALTARLASLPGWRSFRADLGSGVMVCVRYAPE